MLRIFKLPETEEMHFYLVPLSAENTHLVHFTITLRSFPFGLQMGIDNSSDLGPVKHVQVHVQSPTGRSTNQMRYDFVVPSLAILST